MRLSILIGFFSIYIFYENKVLFLVIININSIIKVNISEKALIII